MSDLRFAPSGLRLSASMAARYYTPAELCTLFSISRATLNRWAKDIPGFSRKINIAGVFGRGPCIRYLRSEVHQYLERIESASVTEK